ncbi:MAG TPA: membrane-bound lytic murein transglycosylase MltF, partial [Spongiibacteraceae bacterium]|nr:membrane-bound lytic murein transglycosylase MltF [Spongiibacteraceae bacterium]
MPKLTLKPLLLTGLLACLALLAGCGQSDLLGEVRERGVLKVVTRNGPTTYYESRYGPAGF